MADIMLAEFNGNVWIVSGEEHIDDLLYNTLPDGISVEIVPCDSQADIHSLWVRNCGDPGSASAPWVINPLIAARIKRGNSPDYPVLFAQWSAMMDADAIASVDGAISAAAVNDTTRLVVVEYLDSDGPQMIADLSRLRRQLIEQRLVEAGIDRSRIINETRGITEIQRTGQDSQRVDVIIR